MSNVKNLLPCPFCSHQEPYLRDDGELRWIMCANSRCDAEGPIRRSKAEAIRAWNNRKESK